MGSCWIDPGDTTVYPTQPGLAPDYDDQSCRPVVQFPAESWGADFEAFVALYEFCQHDWLSQINLPEPAWPGSDEIKDEIKQLVQLQQQKRAAAYDEIVAQDQNFQLYFLGLLRVSSSSHPQTYLLLKIAARIGEMMMSVLKMKYNRPRPSQIYPVLCTPLSVARHASYPSGHSLVSHLMAFCAAEAIPNMRDALAYLALRIARLREVAGFHFRSDTIAGQEAAAQAMPIIKQLQTFQGVRDQAKLEWSSS